MSEQFWDYCVTDVAVLKVEILEVGKSEHYFNVSIGCRRIR